MRVLVTGSDAGLRDAVAAGLAAHGADVASSGDVAPGFDGGFDAVVRVGGPEERPVDGLTELTVTGPSGSELVVRACPVVGRGGHARDADALGAPVLFAAIDGRADFRFVHHDDLVRLLLQACEQRRTGTVELATEDRLTAVEVGAALGRRIVRIPAGGRRPGGIDALRVPRAVDTTRLREEWDFVPAWSGREALEDLGRVFRRSRYVGHERHQLPWHLDWVPTDLPSAIPPADGAPLEHAAPPERRGSFDDPIDPRFPVFTAANLGEAFPGPMTPLSLELNLRMLRGGGDGTVHYLGLEEPIATELRARAVCSFGHRLYGNVSVLREMAKSMPGWSPEDIDQQYLGIPKPPGSPTRPDAAERRSLLKLAARLAPRQLGHHAEVDRIVVEARREAGGSEPSALDDERLAARLDLLRDLSIQAWHGATQGNVFAGGVLAALERAGGAKLVARVRGDVGDLTSAAAVVGVDDLAALARREPDAALILAEEPPADALRSLRGRGGELAARLERLLDEVGHRGPGETELANPVFADRPELLVDAVAKAASRDATPDVRPGSEIPLRLRPLAALALRHVRDRERARDAAMRLHHTLRLAVRERGRRLQAAGTLAAPDDVFFLTFAEVHGPPAEVRELLAERRAERERLAGLVMPAHFERQWEPERGGDEPLEPGESLDGIAAAPGRARGKVRVLADAASFDLEPGEVLVARTTDTGWTPMFAFAAAVVTDVGGMASHPAVVAREYGIPAVLNTAAASARLPDGAIVEVDGDAGRVTRME